MTASARDIPSLEFRLECLARERARQAAISARKEEESARARAARPAPSLEDVTLDDRTADHALLPPGEGDSEDAQVWKVRKVYYSSGVCEVRAFLGSASIPRRGKGCSPSSTADDAASGSAGSISAERFQSSIKRSRRLLRERCFELNADHMLTLTRRGKFSTVDDAWRSFAAFSRLMKKFYGDKWRYVVVPERHSDGETWHLHVAVRGFYWAGIVRRLWQKALGGTGYESGEASLGNIDLKSFRRVRGVAGVRRIAAYVAKYLGKGATACHRGRRFFAASRGLAPYRTERRVCRHWYSDRELLRAVQARLDRAGSSGIGEVYFWSRHRADGSLMARGFVLSTDWRGVVA